MSKKNFMNIVPQEMVADGERTLRYKGSDGKFHSVASNGGNKPFIVVTTLNQQNMLLTTDVTYAEIRQAIDGQRIVIVEISGMGYAAVAVMTPQPGSPVVLLTTVLAVDGTLMQVNILAVDGEPTQGRVTVINSSDSSEDYGYITSDDAVAMFLSKEEAAEEYVKKTDALAPVNGFGLVILSQQEFNAIAEPQQNVIYIIT